MTKNALLRPRLSVPTVSEYIEWKGSSVERDRPATKPLWTLHFQLTEKALGFGPGFGPGFAGRRVRAPDPVAQLERYIQQESWFEGLVMAVVFFEAWGKKRLRQLFESKEMTFPTILEKARVGSLIPALKEFGVISEETMTNMNEVNSWRVKLVHRLKDEYDLNPRKAKELLEAARQGMAELISTKTQR